MKVKRHTDSLGVKYDLCDLTPGQLEQIRRALIVRKADMGEGGQRLAQAAMQAIDVMLVHIEPHTT